MQTTEVLSSLAVEALEGLSSKPKSFSSKFFYDEKGSQIFQKIMRMPEYYLTDCEFDILKHQAGQIVKQFKKGKQQLELIELGAGDGIKTKVLIKELFRQEVDFRYIPIDISEEILFSLKFALKKEFKNIEVDAKPGDYFDMMKEIEEYSSIPKVILFLGSNIGNFSHEESVTFFSRLRQIIRKEDRLFVGFDLKKDPEIILKAYNDPHGHTRDFNLNLLTRLNNELGADFDLKKFKHVPNYDPQSGIARSYIVSMEEQDVTIPEIETTIRFKKWEAVYTEMSRKFDTGMIEMLARETGFAVEKNFTDEKAYYLNSLWKPKF